MRARQACGYAASSLQQDLSRRTDDCNALARTVPRQRAAPVAHELRTEAAQRLDQFLDKELPQVFRVHGRTRVPARLGCNGGEQIKKCLASPDSDRVYSDIGKCVRRVG